MSFLIFLSSIHVNSSAEMQDRRAEGTQQKERLWEIEIQCVAHNENICMGRNVYDMPCSMKLIKLMRKKRVCASVSSKERKQEKTTKPEIVVAAEKKRATRTNVATA